ncbi:proline dehydrogenase family protein [Mammaliicoccus sp. Dog046]|uniref:proline dehydrogenase family protein n=1 Tax=Mammaliicoccus sp. Dog046 TaxID=3034233 RepID=UPI002B264032|nr:proline dehydrogenase family protein [Mammaliicoccus sp. Dog046]WQK86386.1 proline dehydrogenase family protein [Mammaliicoccus sp. Dog046]
MPVVKDFFIALSNNKFLNESAKKMGPALGANKVVAGVDIDSTIDTVEKLNKRGMTVTLDNLGEFVTSRQEALEAQQNIVEVMRRAYNANIKAHVSIKLTQLGVNIDKEFAYKNTREILLKASEYGNTFVNIDAEKYEDLVGITETLDKLKGEFDNVGTVIQAYLYDAINIMDKYSDVRLRLVKGAYKEAAHIAYQSKEEIDANYIKLIERRLLTSHAFTSIATHDHNVINHVKQFVEKHNIDKDKFEFQMLFGFRTDYAYELAKEGYQFCMYVPFGQDWFGYFMRRLAERPQNMNLMLLDILHHKNTKKVAIGAGVVTSASLIAASSIALFKKK